MKYIALLSFAILLSVAPRAFAAEKSEPGLIGEYFDIGSSLEDFPTIPADKKPVVKRVDKTIDFESTQEGFHGTQLVDFFYIRWNGSISVPKDGSYTFTLESDDGSRLFIDGRQIIDHNGLHAMEEKSGDVELKAGEHVIKVEYFENDVDAGCKLSWRTPGGTKEIVPASVLSHPAAAPDPPSQAGLRGEYFDLGDSVEDFPTIPADKSPTIKRVDKAINFRSTENTFPGTKLQSHFAIRWTGRIKIPADGKYTFYLESDDGSRLFIDGKQVFENGGLHEMQENSGDVELKAGDHDLKVDYYENENDGGAGCVLSWKSAGLDKEVVPATAFSH